jgi:hypothetical protein
MSIRIVDNHPQRAISRVQLQHHRPTPLFVVSDKVSSVSYDQLAERSQLQTAIVHVPRARPIFPVVGLLQDDGGSKERTATYVIRGVEPLVLLVPTMPRGEANPTYYS